MMAPTRRRFLVRASQLASCALLGAAGTSPAMATPQAMQDAIDAIAKGTPITLGRVTLDLPPLVENGNVVPLTVSVDSAMTQADHVESIHIFNEKNPQPHVVTLYLGPRAGKAHVATRIKLADTQTVTAIARMNDGTLWSASAEVIVTIAACIEELQ